MGFGILLRGGRECFCYLGLKNANLVLCRKRHDTENQGYEGREGDIQDPEVNHATVYPK